MSSLGKPAVLGTVGQLPKRVSRARVRVVHYEQDTNACKIIFVIKVKSILVLGTNVRANVGRMTLTPATRLRYTGGNSKGSWIEGRCHLRDC
jgi:hypothetical protein